MAIANRFQILLKSYGGQAAKLAILIGSAIVDPTGNVCDAIRAAVAACSSGKSTGGSLTRSSGHWDQEAGEGPYKSCRDKATLTFRDADGGTHTLAMPGPDTLCFGGQSKDVVQTETIPMQDPPPLKAVVDAITGGGFTSRDGALLTTYVKESRRRRPGKSA